MALEIDVLLESPAWQQWPQAQAIVQSAIIAAVRHCRKRYRAGSQVCVMLCDDATIQDLNREWRGKDKPTNVLSFPAAAMPGQPRHLGDIAIAFETLKQEAEAEEKSLADHCAHLAVHGFLHLLGYDHETSVEAEIMEAQERAILAGLGIADPYLAGELVHPS